MDELPEDASRALLSLRLSVRTDSSASPVRRETGLCRDTLTQKHRVVGVARDSGTSATKVASFNCGESGYWMKPDAFASPMKDVSAR